MRSPAEIQFRLRQEFGNLAMFLMPPALGAAAPAQSALLPEGAKVAALLRDTPFAEEVAGIADRILEHRFPLLGVTIDTGPAIDWRRDYLHGISTGLPYFRRSPYLDFECVGDHKVVWELNRHQQLPLLAQAFLLTGRRAYLDEAFAQLEDWLAANPFLRGINWASALEVAFRALSWAWLWHFSGSEMREPLRTRFLTELYRHGRFLELNLSVYFSPNTHLLGEAVALHALGALFPTMPHAESWKRTGGRIVEEEIVRQVRADGSHFEQSAYYHVYALDFFLLYHLLGNPPAAYRERLARMAEYLDALLGASGVLPLIGDDDGGRLFHPYGERVRFGQATMATCAVLLDRPEWLRNPGDLCSQAAWWLGPKALQERRTVAARRESRLFADAGTAVMTSGGVELVVKAGGFGEGSGGHSHSDVLSLTARLGGRDILIDPGTFTYIADPVDRNNFRGSAAHNTLRIDGRDQAVPAGPFRWNEKPGVAIGRWASSEEQDYLDATCTYGGMVHRRRILFCKPAVVVVLDWVAMEKGAGSAGEHVLEQFWHLGAASEAARFSFSEAVEARESWRSLALCSKEPATVLSVGLRTALPAHVAMVIDLSECPVSTALEIRSEGGAIAIGRTPWSDGDPLVEWTRRAFRNA